MYDMVNQEKIARFVHFTNVIRRKNRMITMARSNMEAVVDNTFNPIMQSLKELVQAQKLTFKHESIRKPAFYMFNQKNVIHNTPLKPKYIDYSFPDNNDDTIDDY